MPSIPRLKMTFEAPAAAPPRAFRRPADAVAVDDQRLTAGQRLALALLRVYKLAFSPLFAGSCRFLPTCSEYASEAIRRHGVARGTLMAAARLARCHPLAASGADPVPSPRPRA